MNEHEAHALRVRQLEQVLPGLLHPRPDATCLYVGATPWRFQLGPELHDAGYRITLLEVDQDNWYFYLDHPMLRGGCIRGDVRELPAGRTWDTIVWWHGPEHIALDDLAPTVRRLEAAAGRLVVLAAPWGENIQPMMEGNAHQEHKAHLQPEDFARLGYRVATLGTEGDLATWPHILAWKATNAPEQYAYNTSTRNRLVYTAIFGGYDDLRPVDRWRGRFVCFSERPVDAAGWENVVVERRFADPVREARMYKALAHQWLPGVEASLWLDGSAELLVEPEMLFAYLDGVDGVDGVDIVLPRHPSSRTLADEAAFILQCGKADPEAVGRQMAQYARPGLPVGATGWLLRRHTEAIRALNDAWWSELTVHTLRDQLSLPYCLDRLGIEARLIDVDLYDNELVRIHAHRGAA